MNETEFWLEVPEFENVYVSNLGNVKKMLWGKLTSAPYHYDKNGYRRVSVNRKTICIHQLVAMAFLGHRPCGMKLVVDHINKDKTDNRPDNLQIVSVRHNARNRKNTTSKYQGVSWHKGMGKWQSRIRIDGKQKYLGAFDSEFEAYGAYLSARIKVA